MADESDESGLWQVCIEMNDVRWLEHGEYATKDEAQRAAAELRKCIKAPVTVEPGKKFSDDGWSVLIWAKDHYYMPIAEFWSKEDGERFAAELEKVTIKRSGMVPPAVIVEEYQPPHLDDDSKGAVLLYNQDAGKWVPHARVGSQAEAQRIAFEMTKGQAVAPMAALVGRYLTQLHPATEEQVQNA